MLQLMAKLFLSHKTIQKHNQPPFMTSISALKTQTYIGSGESRNRFRRSCLKVKNILFENEQIQIGCKITPIYDFYTSQHYLQVQIFIGNKTGRVMDGFRVDYKGTANLSVWIEEKVRTVREKTQYKQRVIVGCNDFEREILLLMDFQSESLTLKSNPIPITFFTFCVFSPNCEIPDNPSASYLKNAVSSKYQYNEQHEISTDSTIFKKGLAKDLSKFFPSMKEITSNFYIGTFSLKNLIDEYNLIFEVRDEGRLLIMLSSNEYSYFDFIFDNMRFLLSA